jgi:dTDP-glucose 4,6-dehydratase|tara:strand:- start:2067 stop:3080 length:1014 start_codon:yes stop_codon:yes gene_type:complete
MRILVTGGLGFIGSALIRKLIDSTDYNILNLDSCTYAAMPEALENREEVERYQFKKIDIADYDLVKDAIDQFQPNIIFHLAAESHVDRSIENPAAFINTNISGTFNILQSIKVCKDSLPVDFTLVHVSTDEVFGTLSLEAQPFDESSPYEPNSPYSASKASSDLLVRAWHETYGIKTVITNCSNNYGPWQNPEKLIPKIIFNAMGNHEIPIYGNGTNIRDWLHVNDHVDALIAASNAAGEFNRYTIGANQEMSNIDLTKVICSYLDKVRPKNNPYFDQVKFVKDRLGHDLRYAINSSHITETLGFNPAYDLQTGIEETVEWYLNNNDWVAQKVEPKI